MERPVLRYFGGKWRLAPWVISHFPAHRRYVEPFGGAASVLLQKVPAYAEVYNDLDGSMVSFFRTLRSPWKRACLQDALRLTPYSREEFAAAREPAEMDVERARRLCVRSYMAHGSSGLRARSTGFRPEYANPVKCASQLICWRTLPDRLDEVAARMMSVVIENLDAVELIGRVDEPETLIYCDPPYQFSTRKAGTLAEYKHEMSDGQHAELMDCLAASKAMVVLSGYPGSMYDGLGWEAVDVDVFTLEGAARVDRLWLNPLVSERLERAAAVQQLEFEM